MATQTLPTTDQLSTPVTGKPRVKRGLRPHIYHIESRSKPGRIYVVDTFRLSCNCEAGRNRRGCWHLRLGLQYHDWRKAQQARHDGREDGRATEMQALQDAFGA